MEALGDTVWGGNVVQREKGRCCHAKGVGNTTCALAPAIYTPAAGKMRTGPSTPILAPNLPPPTITTRKSYILRRPLHSPGVSILVLWTRAILGSKTQQRTDWEKNGKLRRPSRNNTRSSKHFKAETAYFVCDL